MVHYRTDTSASSLLHPCEGSTRSLVLAIGLERDTLVGRLTMTRTDRVLCHEYTYESTGFALKKQLSHALLWAGYLPLALWAFVHDCLPVLGFVSWATPARLVCHREHLQCKVNPGFLTQSGAIPADHSSCLYLSRQRGCHVPVLYGSTPIPTGPWSGILCHRERHISLCVSCLKPIVVEDTDAYQATFDDCWLYTLRKHPSDSWLLCPNVHNADGLPLQNHLPVWASLIRLCVWNHVLHHLY